MEQSTMEALLEVLEQSVSPTVALSLLHRASMRCGFNVRELRLTPAFFRELKLGLQRYCRGPLEGLPGYQALVEFESSFSRVLTDQFEERQEFALTQESQIQRICWRVGESASEIGCSQMEVQRLQTVTAELARNIVRYVGAGTIRWTSWMKSPKGLRIEAIDQGPGIRDIEQILDGSYHSKSGMGLGLIGCQKLVDRLEIETSSEGTHIVAEYLLEKRPARVEIAYQCRAKTDSGPCGDGVLVHRNAERVFLAVIDGVGHGRAAAQATEEVKSFLEERYDEPLIATLARCDLAIRKTVGAAVSLVRIDCTSGEMLHAGVGNIQVLCPTNPSIHPLPSAGIVGGRFRKTLEQRFILRSGDILLIHTDGIQREVSRLASIAQLRQMDPQDIVEQVINTYAKEHDDATCLVLKY